MVGRLTPSMMRTLRQGIIGLATNDAERIVDSLDQLGMILPSADRRLILRAVQILLRYTYDRSARELTNVDVEAIFGETEHLIRDLPFQIPQDLIYLGRAVGLVSGLAVSLDPDFNAFEASKPFAQEMIARERRETDWANQLRKELISVGQIAATLPRQMDAYYKAANHGDLQVRVDLTRLERSMRRVERATGRLAGGIIATGLFLGGVLLRINGFGDEATWSWIAAGVMTLWSFWPRGEH